jgi:type IV secretion system protein VirB5
MQRHIRVLTIVVLSGVFTFLGTASSATVPVIDAAAILQLVQQLLLLKQQLATLQSQLDQAHEAYTAITGPRGMEQLLPTTTAERNYLPPDWQTLQGALANASAAYASLGQAAATLVQQNALLAPEQLANLTQPQRVQLETARRDAAMVQATSRAAYAQTSARFAVLQGLIQEIGVATDEKAALDLHSRIAAEQAMLGNEQSKLESLKQITDGEARAAAVRVQEAGILGIGAITQLPTVHY